ncbi:MAG TPA: serine/threonine-protein kinase [Dokdonella sp.]|uniref:serine/threonine-protein kinase n=1 Tax=Dokdonella sp. TaxID=2291710 RepID=UPI002D7FBC02|nr:serine/threonine-protein kinase [Dokdonella sp.]HET9032920.1 serine/threonine-protein kinase [Dokdonella sp.]
MKPQPPDPADANNPPDTLVRLRAIFDRVIELPADKRIAWLESHVTDAEDRAAVQRLLQADDTERGVLDTPAGELVSRMKVDGSALEGLVGQSIGAFRLVRLLGKGGMAAVFLGQRQAGDFEQQVAIKLLRRGLYSELEQRLFLRERQVLANLAHPNIAKLFDGDVTPAGIPFLVMEYIDGVPITRYAKDHQLGVRQRLQLLLTVCRAVDAAHRGLVVHRDLKPSNILVDAEGTVKLIDFGIAKLLEDDVDHATVGVYTPDYAAPEQITGQPITTATDVYALGVVMHELLLGLRPQGQPPRRPSALAAECALAGKDEGKPALPMRSMRPILQGDLDNIVLKALSVEADRRYASAGALADDIQRHLDRQPVNAHPPSSWYRARKFVSRHKGGVLSSAAFVLAIVAALAAALWQANVAQREATRADAQAERAISVRDFMVSLFDAAKLKLDKDEQPTPAMLVKEARVRVEADTKMPDSTRADVLAMLGEVSMVNGDLNVAMDLMDRAIALKRKLYAKSAPELWKTEVQRVNVLMRLGRSREALELLRAKLEYFRADNSVDAVDGLQMLASLHARNGELETAVSLAREGAVKAVAHAELDPLEVMQIRSFPAQTLIFAGRNAEGVRELDALMIEWRAKNLPKGSVYTQIMDSLAVAKANVGDLFGAKALYSEITDIERSLNPALGDNAVSLTSLARVRGQLGMYEAAESAMQEVLKLDQASLPANSLLRARSLVMTATLDYAQGRDEAARRILQSALSLCAEPGGDTDDQCARTHHLLGLLWMRDGHLDKADAEISKAIEQRLRIYGDKHERVAAEYVAQADLALARNDAEKAFSLSEKAMAILREKKVDQSHDALLAGIVHAHALLQSSRAAEARSEVEALIADWRERMPNPTPQQFDVLALHAIALAATGELAMATDEAKRALALGLPTAALNSGLLESATTLAVRTDAG